MSKKISLPSGSIAEIRDFKFKDIQAAQRIAGEKTEDYMPALISITTKIDDKDLLFEDVLELDGFDSMALMGEFTKAFTTPPPPKK